MKEIAVCKQGLLVDHYFQWNNTLWWPYPCWLFIQSEGPWETRACYFWHEHRCQNSDPTRRDSMLKLCNRLMTLWAILLKPWTVCRLLLQSSASQALSKEASQILDMLVGLHNSRVWTWWGKLCNGLKTFLKLTAGHGRLVRCAWERTVLHNFETIKTNGATYGQYSERPKAVEGCCDAVGGPEWSYFTRKNTPIKSL